MAERLGPFLRPSGMTLRALTILLAVLSLTAGCGNEDPVADDGDGQFASAPACPSTSDGTADVARADLDGDGTPDTIAYHPSTGSCGPYLSAAVSAEETTTTLDDDLAVESDGSFAVRIPGRSGDIAVLRQEHPRGGFQIVLVAWSAGAGLSTLTVDDHPVFPFVATDTESTPLTARCVEGGIEITQARRHAPIGVVPAWDVERTTYVVNGTSATAGPAQEVADNVLDQQLGAKYADLVHHRLFENCRVGS